MSETTPVEIAPIAGTEAPAEDKTGLNESDITETLALLTESDKVLAAAETKIVSQKRKLKAERDGIDLEAEDSKVEEAVAKALDKLGVKPKSSDEDDEELQAIQTQRTALQAKATRLREAQETLKAKNSMTNAGGGSNQDKLKPKNDLTQSLNADQKVLYQGIADRRGISLEAVLKAKLEADALGVSLINYLKNKK